MQQHTHRLADDGACSAGGTGGQFWLLSVAVLHARLQAAGQQQHPNLLWQFAAMALTARLAACSVASLPAGSAERLAAMVTSCHSTFAKLQRASDSPAEEPTEDRHLRIVAYQALLYTLGALHEATGTLHEVLLHLEPRENTACCCPVAAIQAHYVVSTAEAISHAMVCSLRADELAPYTSPHAALSTPLKAGASQSMFRMLQMSPTIAATWLEALGTLITHVVRTGKPLDGNWDLLHKVSLTYACRSGCLPGRICMRITCRLAAAQQPAAHLISAKCAGSSRRGRTADCAAHAC